MSIKPPVTALTLMGAALDHELQRRGIVAQGYGGRTVARADCEAIMAAVIQRTAEAAQHVRSPKSEPVTVQ